MAGKKAGLKRTLGLATITFYGLGTILGAGIYVLVGKVAGLAGVHVPMAFGIAAVIAALTGLSYAELSSRFPKSAGAAIYLNNAFGKRWLSALVGWLVVCTGIVSSATIANGFVGYLRIFVDVESWLAITILVLVLGTLAAWGIKESAIAVIFITLIEISGLLLVLFVARESFTGLPERIAEFSLPADFSAWIGIILGGFLAFYAFIGFEDMVTMAEEVENPRRNLPLAIILALVISTVLYMAIAVAAVISMPLDELANSDAPLAEIVEKAGYSPTIIGLISLFAVINGSLVQVIMASRVIYGMGAFGGTPAMLTKINKKTQTPLIATILVSTGVLIMALWLPIVQLAKTTSFITLIIFALINFALIIIKRRGDGKGVSYPVIIPIVGFILCVAILIFQIVI